MSHIIFRRLSSSILYRLLIGLFVCLTYATCNTSVPQSGLNGDTVANDNSSNNSGNPNDPDSVDNGSASSRIGACCFRASCGEQDSSCCQELSVDPCVSMGGVFVGARTRCEGDVCDVLGVISQLYDKDGDGLLNGDDPDVDGDGIENGDDSDVDGDGEPNGSDRDVDGDGIENGSDRDIDGDGLENGKDRDADGDGLEFPDDDDDDGDGIDDADDDDDDADDDEDCDCEHGDCFNDNCYCEYGWQGDSCDEFHCKDIRNCNNGTCVGPNTCRCDPGWESVGNIPCAVYNCRALKECNDHGRCVGANKCECDPAWRGLEDCSLHTCDRDPSYCDDNDPCTRNDCEPTSGCKPAAPLCGPMETCIQGSCFPDCRNTLDCDSGNACRDGACQDGCFEDDECVDGDPCTTDTCNAGSDCENTLILCPGPREICVRGRCVTACLDSDACDEGEACHQSGCFAECDDDTPCTGNDETCENGVCVPPEDDTDSN